MKSDSLKQDGFYELMQTQKMQDVSPLLESNIMQIIEQQKETKSPPIQFQSILIFSSLIFAYFIIAFINGYYFSHSTFLNDLKSMVLIGILVHVIYEFNEIILVILNRNKHVVLHD